MTAYPKRNYRAVAEQGRRQAQTYQPQAAYKAPVVKPAPVKVEGDADLWVTLQKVFDPNSGWVKTTRAMTTPAGVLINTCSRRQGHAIAAEALVLVPGMTLKKLPEGYWAVAKL